MKKIAALFTRVSTASKEKQETIDSKVSEIRARIIKEDKDLGDENIFVDDGWTGEMLERPGLDAMRDAALNGQFQVLYVYDRGRLSRIFAYQEIIIEELTNRDIEFITLHDLAAKTPEEHVLQAMQGVFHEYERVKIAERFRRGKLHKARSGVLINGQALYGYRYIRKTETEPARYEINEEEARIVRKIFEWVGLERLSIYEVRKRLYAEGIMPRKGLRATWSRGPIIRMLRNTSYLDGVIYYNKSEAVVAKKPLKNEKYRKVKRTSRRGRGKDEWIPFHVQPILKDNGLFEKVQEVLDFYKKYQPKNRKYDYLLTGLVWCECGQRRVGDGYSKGGNHYYRCSDRIKQMPLPSQCKAQGVNAVIADGLLWVRLKEFLNDREEMKRQAKKWLLGEKQQGSIGSSEKQRIEKQMSEIEEEKLRYTRAYGNGTIDESQLRVLLGELNSKKQGHERRLKELQEVSIEFEIDDNLVERLCDEAQNILDTLNQGEKKKVVQDIIDKVTFYDKGMVSVEGHIPQFSHNMGYELERRNRRSSKRREINPL